MNDPNKVISVNLSSLLSLKAELLRKQVEINKVRSTKFSSDEYEAHKTSKVEQNLTGEPSITVKTRKSKNMQKQGLQGLKPEPCINQQHEDTILLEKSKRILEAKSKYYERMSKSGGSLNSDDNCLVMFNKKRQQYRNDSDTIFNNDSKEDNEDSMDEGNDDGNDSSINSDDEWVEYTDCLGRTRKCLREDLAKNKKLDAELAASMPERLDQTKANWMIDMIDGKRRPDFLVDNDAVVQSQSIFGDGLSTMSKHEEQKANWERKEQENLEKTDVHYQDVFFDEARQHGVGYYAFSTNEEERKRQQKELDKARHETLEEQEKRAALRKQRQYIIAERVWAAKNRQRARAGLPPLNKEEIAKQVETEEMSKETKTERKARIRAEKLEKKLEQEEKERERQRLSHIRPWDVLKNGSNLLLKNDGKTDTNEWIYKPEREPMTQEQWNEYKRSERNSEFAPLTEKPLKQTDGTRMSLKPMPSSFDADTSKQVNEPCDAFMSCQRSKGKHNRMNTYPTNNDVPAHKALSQEYRKGTSIPPPLSLYNDCNKLVPNKKTKYSHDLEQSVEAGLRFLRNNYDKQLNKIETVLASNTD